MKTSEIRFIPDLSPEALGRDLSIFFRHGTDKDDNLSNQIDRLENLFQSYLKNYPYGLWAPGLAVTPEMKRMTELFLPLGEIRPALNRLCRNTMRIIPDNGLPLFDNATSWLDLLQRLPEPLCMVNPAQLFRLVLQYPAWLKALVFALHLPKQHGSSFGRYPVQKRFIRDWLSSRTTSEGKIRCLDVACGCGEGVYELAMLLVEAGFFPGKYEVYGVSLDPLEIFSAAHAYFPHDLQREGAFRKVISPLFLNNSAAGIVFSTGDVTALHPGDHDVFDLIICNGLLGGPLLHDEESLRRAVRLLAKLSAPGGLILAADTFHDGWQRKASKRGMPQLFQEAGLVEIKIEEGVAGMKER